MPWMLLVMQSPVAVLCVLSAYTVYSHCQVFLVHLNYNACFVYVHAYTFMLTFSCDNCYCPCEAFMHVSGL